ncbi:hypothetical protein D1007_32357 [Hordeum vulgare]|nr:hypothetical protein D1007_32357 [Hordeum vulgare]
MERPKCMGDQTSSRYVDVMMEFMAFSERTKRRIGEQDYVILPCKDCTNTMSLPNDELEFHLHKRGFMGGYTRCTRQDEDLVMYEGNNLHVDEVPNPNQSRMGAEFNLGAQRSSYKQNTGVPNPPKENQECDAYDTNLDDMPDFATMIADF